MISGLSNCKQETSEFEEEDEEGEEEEEEEEESAKEGKKKGEIWIELIILLVSILWDEQGIRRKTLGKPSSNFFFW